MLTTLDPECGFPNCGAAASRVRRLAAGLAVTATLLLAPGAGHAADPCQGVPHCQNLGPFTATAVKVNVTRQDNVTAYQGVKTTVRFTNISDQPLILGYRDRSSKVTDNNGLAYRWSAKAYGIGVVGRGVADPQFQLAPGESREAAFDGVLQYSMRRQVAGTVFTHDFTIVQLALVGSRQIREARDHPVSFANLTATDGFGAGASAAPAAGPAPAQAATATPAAAGDPCAGLAGCQAQGPLVANVVRVNVTRSGGVTAYQGVRTTIRFRNLGDQPLVIAYRNGSGVVTDNAGLSYRWSSKAEGIGLVGRGAADPQFRLAPGEAREAAFESVLQYNVRHTQPGSVYSLDLGIVQLQVVGPSQVREVRDYALSFSNLTAGNLGAGALAGAGNEQAAQAVGKIVDLFKALKK